MFRLRKHRGDPLPLMAKRQKKLRNEHGFLPRSNGVEVSIDDELGIDVEDLFIDMKERETEYVSLTNFRPNASYIPYRRYLVDWMSDVGRECNLHNSTIHVSILLLDKVFGWRDVQRSQWKVFATACISVASKCEEAKEYCPPVPDLLVLTKLSHAGHTPLSFQDYEVEVLECLNWKIRAIPPIHVVGYFLSRGVIFETDTWKGRTLIKTIPDYIKKYAEFFCNLTMQEHAFQQYRPSHLAAAILLASRIALQIEPKWRPELVRLAGFEEFELFRVYRHVWSYYEEQFPGHRARSTSPRSVAPEMHSDFFR